MPNRTTAFLPEEKFNEIKSKYPGFNEPWTDEDDKTLVQMYNDGVPFDDMAAQFGRSRRSIMYRLVHLRANLFN